MTEALATYPFSSFSSGFECFRLRHLAPTLLSCSLLFLESGSLPSVSFRSISTPESSQIFTPVFSRSSSGMLFDVLDISTLFLWLYSSPFTCFFQGKMSFLPIYD